MIPALHLDTDTLLASQTLISILFAAMLFIVAYRFGAMRGVNRIAQAFVASSFGTLFFVLGRGLPLFISVLIVNVALLAANLLFYSGVDELLRVKPRLIFPASVALVALLLLTWFTLVHDRADVRIALLSVTDCIMELWLVADLIRSRESSPTVNLLGLSLILAATVDVFRALAVLLGESGAPLLHHSFAQAAYMITGLLATCALGILSLMLVTGQIMSGIEKSARRDPLTGVLNRRGIEERLRAELDRAKRISSTLCIALIDIDNFKTINDTWGHPAGDKILCDISSSITTHLRSYDVCGRIGGDEFMIVLPGSSAEVAQQICERILSAVAVLPQRAFAGVSATVSMGYTESDASDNSESMVARADRALYQAKREGRNRVSHNLPPFRVSRAMYPAPDADPIPPKLKLAHSSRKQVAARRA